MTDLYNQNLCYLSLGSFGPSYFSVTHFETHNLAFNQNYSCTVYFRFIQKIDLSHTLNQPACLNWGENYLQGIVTEIYESGVKISSRLALLNKTPHSRVYADVDFKDLIEIILNKYKFQPKIDVEFILNTHYPVLGYVSQYKETDLDFINRQCSRWGIGFCFIHTKTRAVLIFFDHNSDIFQKLPVINMALENFSMYKLCRKLLPKTVKMSDYNPDTPEIILDKEGNSRILHVPSQGEDDRLYEFYQTPEWGELILTRRLEYYDGNREFILAETGNINLKLGQNIKVDNINLYIAHINYKINILKNIRRVSIKLNFSQQVYRPQLPVLFHMPDCSAKIISHQVDQSGYYFISPDYDEAAQINNYPVRLAVPSSGNHYGFHFPLTKDTPIFITHINGDPDRPVILGVLPTEGVPNDVTTENATQQVLKTGNNNQWFMEDEEVKSALNFNTVDNQSKLNIEKNLIKFSAARNIIIKSQKQITHTSGLNFNQNIYGNYKVSAKNNYKIISNEGSLSFSSGKNLMLASTMMSFKAQKIINQNSRNFKLKAENIIYQSGLIRLNTQNNIIIQSKILNIRSARKLIFAVGNSSVTLSPAGIHINAKAVHFNTPLFVSPPPRLGAAGAEFFHQKYSADGFKLNYINLENRFFPYSLHKVQALIYSGTVREYINLNNINHNDELKMHHAGIEVINVDGKSQAPAESFKFKPKSNYTHQITVLKKPVFKNIYKINNNFECELLTPEELNYFKNSVYKNIIIFLHGYDLEAGEMGDYGYIRTAKEGFNDDDVNGSGVYNWLLHMEYNFNCAAKKSYLQFPWESHALDYTRIIGIHWPGYQKILNIPFSDDLNFSGMEFNAIGSGYALVKLIQQLKNAGLEISIVAHSLGALVAIQLMDLFGRENQCLINQVFLWQAAVADTALSPKISTSMEEKRSAVSQTLLGELGSLALPPLMLYGYYGEFLRQKAADFKKIPLWDMYEINPFSYFPFAHRGAKNIVILSSQQDEVLKLAYKINSVLTSMPHLNFIHDAMGLSGPDSETLKLLKNCIKNMDQKEWLEGHSEMRIPSKILFENIYIAITRELWGL